MAWTERTGAGHRGLTIRRPRSRGTRRRRTETSPEPPPPSSGHAAAPASRDRLAFKRAPGCRVKQPPIAQAQCPHAAVPAASVPWPASIHLRCRPARQPNMAAACTAQSPQSRQRRLVTRGVLQLRRAGVVKIQWEPLLLKLNGQHPAAASQRASARSLGLGLAVAAAARSRTPRGD